MDHKFLNFLDGIGKIINFLFEILAHYLPANSMENLF